MGVGLFVVLGSYGVQCRCAVATTFEKNCDICDIVAKPNS